INSPTKSLLFTRLSFAVGFVGHMKTGRSRKARGLWLLFLLISCSFLLLLPPWLTISGVFHPPEPSPFLLHELPWLKLAEPHNGTFANACRYPLTNRTDPPYLLVALIFNRVHGSDLFGIGPYECRQWIEYMLYAGVEHIFWYDTAHNNAETLEVYIRPYIRARLLTYVRFHQLFPNSLSESFHFEQDNSYRHFLAHFAHRGKWVVQIDVDEYPFSSADQSSCFLHRLIREYEVRSPDTSQILLQCMIFAGNPRGDLVNGWVIERYQRRKYETEGVEKGYQSRQKPIYRADLCKGIVSENPHGVWMGEGKTVVASDERIRMNHYWGARESGFKPDTRESTAMLVSDSSIQPIASIIKKVTGLVKKESDTMGVFLRSMVQW
ncbi:hypothetical protein GOP47_0009873, partial [Adiantum capillus-veneris]